MMLGKYRGRHEIVGSSRLLVLGGWAGF
jgi:hypothetical protein